MHHIAITSMTGGRNRGCEALVTSILLGLESVIPRGDLSIDLHTRDVDYDRDFFAGRVNKVLPDRASRRVDTWRSEEHTSELQYIMRITYAVFCLQKKTEIE